MARLLRLLCALALLSMGHAIAQSPSPVRYAVLSAVGDQVTAVYAKMQTGSRLDQNEEEIAPLPDNTLDRLVLKHVDKVLRATPNAEVAALSAANASLFELQRGALSGKLPGNAAVRRFADALPPGGADRLLLVLKARTEARIPIDNGTIGAGRLEGVGFYIDRVTMLRAGRSGYIAAGFLAPFAYVRLVVADAGGNVLAERRIEEAVSYGMGDAPHARQPWEMLDTQSKVLALDHVLQRAIERELPQLLSAR
jgi:hypothetical protein